MGSWGGRARLGPAGAAVIAAVALAGCGGTAQQSPGARLTAACEQGKRDMLGVVKHYLASPEPDAIAGEVREGAAAGEAVDETMLREVERLPASPRRAPALANLRSARHALQVLAGPAREPGADPGTLIYDYLTASGVCGRVRLTKPVLGD